MKYARVLLAHCPERTTEFFKLYYTGQYQPRTEVNEAEPEEQQVSTVQSLANLLPLRYMTGGTGTRAPPAAPETDPTNKEDGTDELLQYNIPKPRTAFSAFVDHPKEFIGFLETLVEQPGLKQEDKVDLFTTLFEMYLDTAKSKRDPTEKQEWEDKAKKLIEGKDVSAIGSPKVVTALFHGETNPNRYPYLHQMFSYCPTCPTFVKGLHSCGNKKVFASTSSARSPPPRIRKAPFRRYGAMGPTSLNCILMH